MVRHPFSRLPLTISLSAFVLFDGFEEAVDGIYHRLGIEDPFDEVADEISRLALGTQRRGAPIPLSNAFRAGSRERQKPLG
jgi:hypothetical protein